MWWNVAVPDLETIPYNLIRQAQDYEIREVMVRKYEHICSNNSVVLLSCFKLKMNLVADNEKIHMLIFTNIPV